MQGPKHSLPGVYFFKYVFLKPALDMTAAFWTPTVWIGLFKYILQANKIVLIKIEAQFTKKKSKRRERNFFRFFALLALKKVGPISIPQIYEG
jgi:hypothetical protein